MVTCKICEFKTEDKNEMLDHLTIMHPAEVEKAFFEDGKYEMVFVFREYKARQIFK